MAKAATKAAEDTNVAEMPTKGKTRKPREPDTSLPGRMLDAVKEYRKAYRKGGAQTLAEARQEAADARREVADTCDRPDDQDAAIKRLQKANRKIDRLINKRGELRDSTRELLDAVHELLDEAYNENDDQ